MRGQRGKEIAVIGHTDCQVRRTSVADLIERFKALGISRQQLPNDLTEFFGVFSSERQNVIRSCEHVRQSPLIGPAIPVHGLMVDVQTGRLEWVVNGYDTLSRAAAAGPRMHLPAIGSPAAAMGKLEDFVLGEMKFPEQKIGEAASAAVATAEKIKYKIEQAVPSAQPPPPPPQAPKPAPPIAVPPPIQMKPTYRMRR